MDNIYSDLSEVEWLAVRLRNRGTPGADEAADAIEKLTARVKELESAIVPTLLWETFTIDDFRKIHACFPNGPGPILDRAAGPAKS